MISHLSFSLGSVYRDSCDSARGSTWILPLLDGPKQGRTHRDTFPPQVNSNNNSDNNNNNHNNNDTLYFIRQPDHMEQVKVLFKNE